MDLPTYTNIWRIEKRLYKLYDFRLPMPLPINWIAVFTGITLPYVVLLIAIGLPFNHTLLWLYVLPPGLLTWLTTRPVIEGKRLPELVESQVRYLTEPRTWVRLTPLAEKDQMVLSARVWRGRQASERAAAAMAAAATASPGASGAARGAVARRGRAKARVPAVALNAAPVPVPVRDHGQSPGRTPRRANGQVVTPGSPMRQRVLALGPGGGGRATPTLPASRPEPRPPTSQPTPSRRPVMPAVTEGVPVRARAGALGAPPLEVSHDRPSQRPVRAEPAAPPVATRPVTTLPGGNVGNTWPSPARPLRPVRTAPAPAESAPAAVEAASAPAEAPSAAVEAALAPVEAVPAPAESAPAAVEAALAPVEAPPAPVEAPPAPVEAPPAPVEAPLAPVEAPLAPVEAVPVQAATVGETQVDVAPADEAPADVAPVDVASAEVATVDSAQADEATVDVAPVEAAAVETPVGASPEHVAPVEPASAEPVPVEAEPVPVEPAPAEPALAEAALAEPAPAEPALAEAALAEPESAEPALAEAALAEPESPEPESAEPAPPLPVPVDVPASPSPVDRARLEHSHEPAQATAPVQETQNRAVPSIERALSGPSREQNPSWHGKVKIVTGAGASHGPGARDQEALDRNRARLDVPEPRRILVLGCTGGAGQTVTALMTGYMLASLREHPVAVVDLHDGTLARYRAPAAWLDEILAGRPPQQVTSSRPDGLNPTPKPSPARLDVIASHQQARDGDEIKLAVQLNRHYPLTVLDPGPSFLTRLLKVTDQLVVVVPANAEAAGALADTRDWLDNNGHAELAMQSVTVINGVSRRSLPDVEHAESIARGRSRAIVRIPWDDMLPVAAAGPSTLRPQTRVAYTALAGVLVAGLAAVPVRKKP